MAGWARTTVRVVENRPVRCVKCHLTGHTRAECKSENDIGYVYFRCGVAGHLSRECASPPYCWKCADEGKKSEHRLGGKGCCSTSMRTESGPKETASLMGSLLL